MVLYIKVLFTKHKKKLPKKLRGTVFDEIIRYGIVTIISAWVFQGTLYANWRDNFVKFLLDIIFTLLFSIVMPWWIGFLIAHTLNYCFNAQAKAVYNHMGAGNKSASDFYKGVIAMKKRAEKTDCLAAVIAYGSLSRGCYKPTSDIDVRFIPKHGEWNFWKATFWTLKERIISFATNFPLDSYVFSLEHTIKVMRSDELPIILLERDGFAQKAYPDRIEWKEWCEVFKKEQKIDNAKL